MTTEEQPVRVDVVCVNYRTEHLLPGLVDDVAALRGFGVEPRMVVVDCSGTCPTTLADRGVEVLDPGENLGFGRAVDLAVRQTATCPTLLLVNPDVRFEPAAVTAVLEEVAAGRAVAATGRLRNPDGTLQRNTAPRPTLRQMALVYLAGIDTRQRAGTVRREVEVVTGSLVAVDRDAFERVGGFDPRLPLYMEDVALSVALAEHGPLVQLPLECGTHVGGAAAAAAPGATAVLLHASRVAYFRIRGRCVGTAARAVVVVGCALRRAAGRDVPLGEIMAATRPGTDLGRLLPARGGGAATGGPPPHAQ